MWRTLSALKKTRLAGFNAQLLISPDVSALRARSERIAVWQSWKGRKSLPDLPPEIIFEIADYLPPSSLSSFEAFIRESPPSANSSPCDWPSFAKLEDICEKQGTLYSDSSSKSHSQFYLSERLEMLCMLDRDGGVPPSKAVCSGCLATHGSSLFSVSSLAQPSRNRRCLGSAGRFWVYPRRIFDHSQTHDPRESQRPHICGHGAVCIGKRATIWRLMNVHNGIFPSDEEVKGALRPLQAPICPHMRLSDPCVPDVYNHNCEKLRRGFDSIEADCSCSSCSSDPWPQFVRRGECKSCGTYFLFYNEGLGYRRAATLNLMVQRNIEISRDCTDSAWIAQATNFDDFEELESAWRATNLLCGQRLGAVTLPDTEPADYETRFLRQDQ